MPFCVGAGGVTPVDVVVVRDAVVVVVGVVGGVVVTVDIVSPSTPMQMERFWPRLRSAYAPVSQSSPTQGFQVVSWSSVISVFSAMSAHFKVAACQL